MPTNYDYSNFLLIVAFLSFFFIFKYYTIVYLNTIQKIINKAIFYFMHGDTVYEYTIKASRKMKTNVWYIIYWPTLVK